MSCPDDLDPQLLEFMPHEVGIEPVLSTNLYAEASYGTLRTASAYVPPRVQLRDSNTMDVHTRPVTAIIADTDISLGDRITLPDGKQPEVDHVEKMGYVSGLYHTVVTFR